MKKIVTYIFVLTSSFILKDFIITFFGNKINLELIVNVAVKMIYSWRNQIVID